METLTFDPKELKQFIDNKTDKQNQYNLERKQQWDSIRKNNQHFLDTTKEFFSEYGIKIDFINNTEFNLKEAQDGFYPYLRLNMQCFKVASEIGYITHKTVKYTYTEFIKKHILPMYKFN